MDERMSTASEPLPSHVEVAIIGGGQAGLSASYLLTQQGRDHVVLEKADRLAAPWRAERWDSFHLATPNWTVQLPGFGYTGPDADGFLPRDDLVRYFEDYAASFRAPVIFGVEVIAVDREASGAGFVVTTREGRLLADNVIVATGTFQRPKLPTAAAMLPGEIVQLHSSQYRNPDALPPGAVLVVGTAQSGSQIADELHRSGREVYLSVGQTGRVPLMYRGQHIIRWLVDMGFFDIPWEEVPEPKSRGEQAPHIGDSAGRRALNLHRFAREGMHLIGHIDGASDHTLHLASDLHASLTKADEFEAFVTGRVDGFIAQSGVDAPPRADDPTLTDGFAVPEMDALDLMRAGIRSIVWATGFTSQYDWVHFPVLDATGFPIQRRGITDVPGLSFLGLYWMYSRGSGTIFGVGKDAEHVVADIVRRSAPERTTGVPIAS